MIRKTIFSLAVLLLASVPLALAQGTYTQIDYPGSVSSGVYGINSAGEVVGYYQDSANLYHGFLLSNGIYTTIDVPGQQDTYANGINDVGQIVGQSGNIAFVYDRNSQAFTTIQPPANAVAIAAYGINNSGEIVGDLEKLNQNHNHDLYYFVGFTLESGTLKVTLPRGFTFSDLNGINNLGVAAGDAETLANRTVNFLYSGTFQRVGIPASRASAIGVNDLNTIVGAYFLSTTSSAGFVFENGSLQTLIFPGAATTVAEGINNSVEVSGIFADASGIQHGFTWTPPAAASEKK